ncbi:MAG: 2,3,4,5-tetrahydropyridine-2,6-dicarboxylate N-succinyltransferase [Acidobacteria bacterium]|nr:MAG: 2,3,4,5-tetrahydropyridine-2,6-dicarboxylate N-succinyltransferase [Acidobacteriota bacterium]
MPDLAAEILRLSALADLSAESTAARDAFEELKGQLNRGTVRAAEPSSDVWRVNTWVKQGILLGFRLGALKHHASSAPFTFFDKDTLPTRSFTLADQVRLVPGGTTVRDGAYLAPGVICMPPAYVNIGAWVGEGTMVDSHALVGSCAQIGRHVHLSAAAQVGGVLEPVNALPVVIEDDALIGGNCGIYEGTQIGAGAVLGAGVILTRSVAVYDLPRETIHRAEAGQPLRIPAGAVVVPGARRVSRGPDWGLSLATPVIVKYRDSKTDAAVELETWLR